MATRHAAVSVPQSSVSSGVGFEGEVCGPMSSATVTRRAAVSKSPC